jgi:hypothetical protein
MIDPEKFKKWIQHTRALTDQFERVRSDPMQHITEQERDAYILDFFTRTDEMLNTNFAEEFKKENL